MDPSFVRIAYVILTILTGFVPGLFLYLIMTFIVPVESEGQGRPD
jgi:phage shock protein PspC (stress-responsive transcriptional regulator)